MADTVETAVDERKIRLVCSNRPRAQLANNHSKGHQWWVREVHHASIETGAALYHGARTLCGRDASDWLVISGDHTPEQALGIDSNNLCSRCAKKLAVSA